MTAKDKNRLARQFEGATPEQLGEALASAQHVLKGNDGDAKIEAKLIEEYIASLETKTEAPRTVKVECVKSCTVDGVPFAQGTSGTITVKQYNALSRFFKKAAALVLLIGIGVFTAMAQQYRVAASIGGLNGGTNNVAASTTTSQLTLGATQEKNFVVQLNTKLNAAGTSAITITEYHAGDGTNYSATGATASVNGNGTSLVTLTWERTNMLSGYYAYTIQNGNSAAAMTNVQFLHINIGTKAL